MSRSRASLVIGTGAALAGLAAAAWPSLGAQTMPPRSARAPRYTPVYTLHPREGVFAYARISPDGKRLAYASQLAARPSSMRDWTIIVVDLATGKNLLIETGIDAYWSNDGARIIYGGSNGVAIRHVDAGTTSYAPEASGLGDYYSWSVRNGRDLILTIQNNYYYLDGDKPLLPAGKVPACDKIGTGERPLISHDGTRLSTFVNGYLVVRGLDHCDDIIAIGIQGSKADFSWDGRYLAFHAVKKQGTGYEIRIVDLQRRTVRTLDGLAGSALFPSWTQDGRLSFRYDGPEYRGFMLASDVLSVPDIPLPAQPDSLPDRRTWQDIFPETPVRAHGMRLVMIWAPWSAHSREAFASLELARSGLETEGIEVEVLAAADPGSREADIASQLADFRVTVRRIPLSQRGLLLTEARNQMPSLLLFRDGVLVDRRLGAQSAESLREWVASKR